MRPPIASDFPGYQFSGDPNNNPLLGLSGAVTVDQAQEMAVVIDPVVSGGPNRLVFYSGTIVSRLDATGFAPNLWNRRSTLIAIPIRADRWTLNPSRTGRGFNLFVHGTAIVSPASVFNDGDTPYGVAVDAAFVDVHGPAALGDIVPTGYDDRLVIAVAYAVFGNRTQLLRLNYHLTVLGRTL